MGLWAAGKFPRVCGDAAKEMKKRPRLIKLQEGGSLIPPQYFTLSLPFSSQKKRAWSTRETRDFCETHSSRRSFSLSLLAKPTPSVCGGNSRVMFCGNAISWRIGLSFTLRLSKIMDKRLHRVSTLVLRPRIDRQIEEETSMTAAATRDLLLPPCIDTYISACLSQNFSH